MRCCKSLGLLTADRGYCASKQLKYYGFKGHLIINFSGVITGFTVTKANVSLPSQGINLPTTRYKEFDLLTIFLVSIRISTGYFDLSSNNLACLDEEKQDGLSGNTEIYLQYLEKYSNM